MAGGGKGGGGRGGGVSFGWGEAIGAQVAGGANGGVDCGIVGAADETSETSDLNLDPIEMYDLEGERLCGENG